MIEHYFIWEKKNSWYSLDGFSLFSQYNLVHASNTNQLIISCLCFQMLIFISMTTKIDQFTIQINLKFVCIEIGVSFISKFIWLWAHKRFWIQKSNEKIKVSNWFVYIKQKRWTFLVDRFIFVSSKFSSYNSSSLETYKTNNVSSRSKKCCN